MAGKYKFLGKDKDGKDQFSETQHGAEKIDKRTRTYDPTTNLLTGEPNQPGGPRNLLGWVDIDTLG